MFMRIVLPAMALACLATAPAAAQTDPVRVAVPYGDLDLTKDEGRKRLDARLERAARRACGTTSSIRTVSQMIALRTCLAEARTSYQSQLALALDAANDRRVAMLADKLYLVARF